MKANRRNINKVLRTIGRESESYGSSKVRGWGSRSHGWSTDYSGDGIRVSVHLWGSDNEQEQEYRQALEAAGFATEDSTYIDVTFFATDGEA